MSRRLRFYILVLFASICIFILALTQRYSLSLDHRLPILSEAAIRARLKYQDRFLEPTNRNVDDPYDNYVKGMFNLENITITEINEVIEQQRAIIEQDMKYYEYVQEKSAKKLAELVIEQGGDPIRSIILSTWRSGSTFLGDILNSHPGNFYHYEPLLHFGIVQIRDEGPVATEALNNLESMFKCDYSNLDRYLAFGKDSHPWVFNHNTHLWERCQIHKSICWDQRFVTRFCKLFPFQSMKIVRLRLHLMERFLQEDRLRMKVVLLIRDPRGALQSRKHRDWCPTEPDCFDPAILCSDMVLDYKAASKFSQKYPSKFKVIRYEDLSLDPLFQTKILLKFFGLNFHDSIKTFLETHTKTDIGGLSSTFRNSKTAPFHWRQELDFDEVQEIQRECDLAMKLWGYNVAVNATHQKYFDPVTNYNLKEIVDS